MVDSFFLQCGVPSSGRMETVGSLAAAEPGDWIRATSLFDQSYEHAAIIAMSVENEFAE